MRRAAVRRTEFELGINDLEISDLYIASRILYYAESCDRFAEHELDYIIFARKNINTDFRVNPDEIEAFNWVGYHDFEDFLNEKQSKHNSINDQSIITPWFQILKERKLMRWWKELIDTGVFPKESHYIDNFTKQI